MTEWQRRTRLALLVAAIGIAIAVVAAFRRSPLVQAPAAVAPSDPKALVESASGFKSRLNRDHEEVRIDYKTLTTYPDNSAKLSGVKVTTIRAGGRTFVITGNQADLKGENDISLHGDVRIVASDGMEIRTEHASYTDADAVIRAPGPVEFTRGRLSGSGLGATYAKNDDVLTIEKKALVRMTPTSEGSGAANFSAGSAEFIRNQHLVRLNAGMTVTRGGQILEAEAGVAHLSEDEQRLEAVDLRGNSTVRTDAATAGALKGMRARDIDIKYGPDGETLERAVLDGKAEVDVAGEPQQAPRKIAANHLEIALSADGSTPRTLTGNDGVQLNIPGDPTTPSRIIDSQKIEATGEEGRGLTRARFTGEVRFRERGSNLDRLVRSAVLNVAVKAGLSEIEDARFEQSVRFQDGDMTASAATARYVLAQGTLELSGTEPASPVPRMENQRIAVDATKIDVTLDGPIVVASKAVKSALKPAKPDAQAAPHDSAAARVPSMFKQDQVIAATAEELKYDGGKSNAIYTGNAQMWQGDTSIKGVSITIDQESGDLTAAGPVVTAITLEQEAKDKTRERVHSTGTSKNFAYQESSKRATYTGDAHMNGPQGDMAAAKIELYLKASGNELDRAEAYEAVTLRDQNRETKGARMTYFSADQRYVVTGTPVTITDECARVTTGRTATFNKTTDTVVVDGNQTRTATRGSANCPSR